MGPAYSTAPWASFFVAEVGGSAALTQLATVPMVVAGVSMLVERGGRLYWAVAAVVASFLAALVAAWVLLIEIHR